MKMKFKIALVIATIALLCVVGWSSKAQNSSTNWEYKVTTKYRYHESSPTNVKEFNDLGAEGWELVTVISEEVSNPARVKLSCYFKRRL